MTIAKKPSTREPKVSVSEANIAKAAMRLHSQKLVSAEVHFVRRTLGASASQTDLDAQVIAVRKMPWGSLAEPE